MGAHLTSMKIVTIVGARPQFVKAAAFSRELSRMKGWSEVIVHTGQHYDTNMSAVFFDEMKIPTPHYNLQLHSLPREQMIEEMRAGILEVLKTEGPSYVLVYGDTNSTLAGALAAKDLGIKLAHVEAGLRSFNLNMPEELNRIATDKISDLLFVPAQNAAENLKSEGVSADRIFDVGDIMYDAVQFYGKEALSKSSIASSFFKRPYSLLTIHRQENTDQPQRLKELFKAIDTIATKQRVVLPLHPRTHAKMKEFGIVTKAEVIDPVGYFDMLNLISRANLVMTDSGGLQKEAFYLGKYCITLREETEWKELVDIGANRICGVNSRIISAAFEELLTKPFQFDEQPYGKGNTAKTILKALQEAALK